MHRPKTPTRITRWVLAMAMVWLTSCASRQATVTPYVAGEQSTSGVVYYLPKTQLRIHFILSEEQFEPGPLVAYASRYLGESYATQPTTRYQIERVAMHAHGVPDTTQSYLIQSVATPSVEQLVALTPDGLLYSLHGKAYKPTTTDYLADYPKGVIQQEASQALPQEYALATSRAKQAEVVASRLFELRERRVELLSGQVETMPCDGPALKMVLDGLDKEIAALQALFAGRTSKRYYEEIVDVPIDDPVSQQVVARFAPQYGLVDKEDLSGAPIYISVEALNHPAPQSDAELHKLTKSTALRYIEPRRARVSLQLPERNQAIMLELSVAQWGRTAILEHKLGADKLGQLPYTIYFDLTSGSIELIELPQQ
ncbi:DUF4831 family protein [uncultured Porphyromonas sp.]|uniref:DUF4831 family protein n=1 Tax=uncultured Porphyromonas sp. TaxID=159274 RepID=UPI0026110F03|nr:DUF4831 family protein [uncultured Porphyromonas sp.]